MEIWRSTLATLSELLGHHGDPAETHELTLPELGALIVAVGRSAGFSVATEVSCGPRAKHRMDAAWYRRGNNPPSRDERAANTVVAWEFDARDVGQMHLVGTVEKRRGTFEKLREFPDAIRVQALYSIRGDRMQIGKHLDPNSDFYRENVLAEPRIRLITDEALIRGGLALIVEEALATL